MDLQLASLIMQDNVAVVTINSPPVNALSNRVRAELGAALQQAYAMPGCKGVVLKCAGRTFFAGADISEIGKPKTWPDLGELAELIERAPVPVVAAMHGSAFGGGLELALSCHYRVAVPSAKVGLPEVNLGLIPGGGGTQRLPRIIGPGRALEVIAFGRPLSATQALELGLLDALADERDLAASAVAFLRQHLDAADAVVAVRDRQNALAEAASDPGLFDRFRDTHARAFRGQDAPEAAIRAVEAAVNQPFDEGLKTEAALFTELAGSTQSAARRYAFFAERRTAKVPGIGANTKIQAIAAIAVIGGGLMGSGIATCFLAAGLRVALIEQSEDALARGTAAIERNLASAVKRGQLSEAIRVAALAALSPSTDMSAVADADLVIEAIFEDMEAKRQLFSSVDALARPDALIASNTSFLDLDALAQPVSHRERFLGLHFFSPANIMPLLEIVRGAATSDGAIATAMQLARAISKTPVLSGNCEGFIANRAMAMRTHVANALLLDGLAPQDIDRAGVAFGFPMGPFQMADLVGLDVMASTGAGKTVSTLLADMAAAGRLGQKSGKGFYDYGDDRKPAASPEVDAILARHRSGPAKPELSDEQISQYLLFPVVNEAARLLEEGIAQQASDIDVALRLGYGWPISTGGPMFWADTVGLDRVIAGLGELAARFGEAYEPCSLLKTVVARNGALHQVTAGKLTQAEAVA